MPIRTVTQTAKQTFLVILAATVIASCGTPVNHTPLSAERFAQVDFTQLVPERWWGDEVPPQLMEGLKNHRSRINIRLSETGGLKAGERLKDSTLILSGGSANGAFGAGLLAGWTESGTRPEFSYVTGVSTGAMIAPFAFLGADYDEELVAAYTSIRQENIFEKEGPLNFLFGSAFADTTPLKELVATYIDDEMVAAIAQQYKRGRSLVVVTTNLDALRPVVWEISAIAYNRGASGTQLIRDIIVASAAIPGFFPPIAITFESDGETFTELHVDGGVAAQVYAYPPQLTAQTLNDMLGLDMDRELFIVQNGNFSADYEPASSRGQAVVMRSIKGLLQNQINGDIQRIYYIAQRDGIDFNMIAIPPEFRANRSSDFEKEYMNALADLGRKLGKTGDFWRKKPPALRDNAP